jgi:hypothetical protein
MSRESTVEDTRKTNSIIEISTTIFIFVLILAISALILNELFGWYQVGDTIAIASGMGAIGTLILAWFTFQSIRQNRKLVQQQQRQIEHQKDKSKPIIKQVGDFKPASENELKFKLKNAGRGDAYDIKIRSDIFVKESSINTANQSIAQTPDNELPDLEGEYTSVYREHEDQTTRSIESIKVLESGEEDVLKFRIQLNNPNKSLSESVNEETDKSYPPVIVFSNLLDILDELQTEHAVLQLTIQYNDIHDEKYKKTYLPWVIDLEEVDSVNDLINSPVYMQEEDGEMSHARLSKMRFTTRE